MIRSIPLRTSTGHKKLMDFGLHIGGANRSSVRNESYDSPIALSKRHRAIIKKVNNLDLVSRRPTMKLLVKKPPSAKVIDDDSYYVLELNGNVEQIAIERNGDVLDAYDGNYLHSFLLPMNCVLDSMNMVRSHTKLIIKYLKAK